MFVLVKFKTIVQIYPSELQKNINELVLSKLKNKIEGKCMKHGYVKKGSVSIIKRSGGEIIKQHFNGQMCFNIVCNAEICNPSIGTVLKSRIVAINHTAAKAEYVFNGDVIIEFLIPRITAGIVSEIDIDTLKVGDIVNVEVFGGKKYKLNDTCINIIGRIINEDKNTTDDTFSHKDEYTEEEPKFDEDEIEQEEEDEDEQSSSEKEDNEDSDVDVDEDADIDPIDDFEDVIDDEDDINFDDD